MKIIVHLTVICTPLSIEKKTFSGTCGGQVSGTSGTITTPEWPNRYPYNAKCGWVFQVGCPQYLNQKIVSTTKIT